MSFFVLKSPSSKLAKLLIPLLTTIKVNQNCVIKSTTLSMLCMSNSSQLVCNELNSLYNINYTHMFHLSSLRLIWTKFLYVTYGLKYIHTKTSFFLFRTLHVLSVICKLDEYSRQCWFSNASRQHVFLLMLKKVSSRLYRENLLQLIETFPQELSASYTNIQTFPEKKWYILPHRVRSLRHAELQKLLLRWCSCSRHILLLLWSSA